MKLSLAYDHRLDWMVAQQFRRLKAQIVAGWVIQHKPDGSHGNVSADSVCGAIEMEAPWTIDTTAILSPAQITGNQSHYFPVGIDDAMVVRLTTDASRGITGMRPPPGENWVRRLMINVGAENVVLNHQNSNSGAIYRFICPNAGDLTLAPGDSAWVMYDRITLRWRVEGV
jgi:hypothetical protein